MSEKKTDIDDEKKMTDVEKEVKEAEKETGAADAPPKAEGKAADASPKAEGKAADTTPDGREEAGKTPDKKDGKSEQTPDAKKPLFGKKKPDPLKEKIDELQDRCMRQMAEFENFRKRTDREKAQMFDTGVVNVVEKLLPVVDNFERGLAAAPASDENKAFADGMNMIYKQLVKMLDDLGVKPIEALGQDFDPNFHNAVMQVEATKEYTSGKVAQEMQKGYIYHDTVVRHSMVAVAE